MAEQEENKEVEKTVEELAREAMEAIKISEQLELMQEEEDAKIKEQNLKTEVENRIKKKMKRIEREMEKEEKNKQPEIDTTFMVHWSNPDKKGFRYEGNYNDKFTFRINRGIMLYHLYVEDKKLITESWHHKSHTSIDLYTLKEKADKLLKEFISKKKKENESKGQNKNNRGTN